MYGLLLLMAPGIFISPLLLLFIYIIFPLQQYKICDIYNKVCIHCFSIVVVIDYDKADFHLDYPTMA